MSVKTASNFERRVCGEKCFYPFSKNEQKDPEAGQREKGSRLHGSNYARFANDIMQSLCPLFTNHISRFFFRGNLRGPAKIHL